VPEKVAIAPKELADELLDELLDEALELDLGIDDDDELTDELLDEELPLPVSGSTGCTLQAAINTPRENTTTGNNMVFFTINSFLFFHSLYRDICFLL
jgi:hypothetical protein